jgi:hypothetical protein
MRAHGGGELVREARERPEAFKTQLGATFARFGAHRGYLPGVALNVVAS